jgi:class 3 adenylate cyclase/tetratricopeptide (TPR) repeat protein
MVDAAAGLTPTTALALSDKPSLRCSKCGHDNGIGAKFCEECASQLARICASCGTQFSAEAKYCPECAHPAKSLQSRFFSPDTYTPTHLAQKILTSKTAVTGERKQLTALFAHLEGAMQLLEDRDPEEACKILHPVLERMMEAVHHYEGSVNQVTGDGIMALFGAPLAHEDHAVRACYAALRMQEAVRRYADELRLGQGAVVQIRIGVNSGQVVVRSIGSDLRMDYTAVGQTTHLAARLEQLAPPGSIWLTAGTVHLVEGRVDVKPLGMVPIKGLGEPTEVFELVGAGLARSRLEATARRGLTRFVGRNFEMQQLQDALDRANLGRGQVVAVVGEPGVGKSRLVWEVAHSDRLHDWLVLRAGSVSYGKTISYLPIIEVIRGYFQIQNQDDFHQIQEKVTSKLLSLDKALQPALMPLLVLLDVPIDDEPWKTLDPGQRRHRTLDALKQLLLREAQKQPLLFIVEDLHWIDGESQSLLDSLVDSLPAARVVLVVNYRPEYNHTWGSKTYYRQLRIDPLPPEGIDELLDTLLGTDATLSTLRPLLVAQTEANPLFLEESVRALVETGKLGGKRGAYRLTRPMQRLMIPDKVQAIMAARIDRLAPEAKRLLQAAAVIGKDVPLPLLLAIADAPQHEVRAELSRLQSAEFLYEASIFPDLQYTFKHALTHEVAYQGLLQDRRRTLHAAITSAIERLSAERIAEQSERLAYHALHGELWEQAVAYLRQAGLRALDRGTNRDAVSHLEQALVALRRLPETQATNEMTIDTHIDLRNALYPSGDWARMREHLHQGEILARSLGDLRRLGRIATFMVPLRRATGDYAGAVDSGREALTIARTLGDRSIEVVATSYLGFTHLARGEFSEAASLFEQNVELQSDDRSERFGTAAIQLAVSKAWLADVLSELGRFIEAIGHGQAALQIAETANHPHTLYFTLFDLGLVHLRRADFQRAIRDLERGLDICRTSNDVVRMPLFAAALGAAYALAGRSDEALAHVEGAVQEFHRHQVHFRPAFILLCAGMTYTSFGKISEANAHALEALALARRLGARGSEAHALCLNGDVASARGVHDADGYYRRALAIAEPSGMRPLVAHCHLGLGKMHRRAGKHDRAQEEFAIAMAMYREMEMAYWLERAEAELGQLC